MIDGCYSSVSFMNVLLATFQMCFIAFQIFTVCGIIYMYVFYKVIELNEY